MPDYGLPEFTAYAIVAAELVIAVFLMTDLYLKFISAFAFLFLVLFTIAYSTLHFILGIGSCDCFGYIEIFNTDNLPFYLFKNFLLIGASFYIYKNSFPFVNSSWIKKIISSLSILFISFLAFKYNDYYLDNFSKKKENLPLEVFQINNSHLKGIDYLFVFSPACSHCIEAIPKIISLKKKYQIKLVGIMLDAREEEWKKVGAEFDINFEVIKVNKQIFNNITKLVPVIYKINNDTIRNTLNLGELSSNLLSEKETMR